MRVILLCLSLVVCVDGVSAQEMPRADAQDSARARRGAEFLIPVGSFVLPGLGQYIHGSTGAGLGFTGTAAGGLALSTVGDAWGDDWDDFPRRARDQLADQASHVALTAAYLSAWDAFHRGVPGLQTRGRYEFLPPRETVGDLLTAPFDPRFLRRWTTWVDLAQTLLITTLILSERESGRDYYPLRGRDIAWAGSLALNAAVGEEAVFRGWLLPLLHERTGETFWVANGIQAGIFGAAHFPEAEWYSAVIAAWAAWEGWIVRRNDWSIRESVFHHFWYNAAIVTASIVAEERPPVLSIRLPTLRF